MNSKTIKPSEALERLKKGETIEGLSINFKGAKVKALDAFKLGKAGVDVPDEVIVYEDADVAYDPEFDDYQWKRTDLDPLESLKEKLTVNIEVDKQVNAWIQKNHVEIDHLIEKLIHDFYAASQMVRGE
jgi:hypothetical protein